MSKIKKLFKKWWLVVVLPLLTLAVPAVYLTGLDLGLPSRATTPEARVKSFLKKADRNRRRTELIDSLPLDLNYELEESYKLREFFVFRSSGFPYEFDSNQNIPDSCDSVKHYASVETIVITEFEDPDTALVETKVSIVPDKYFIYLLKKKQGYWQLANIFPISTPPGKRLFSSNSRYIKQLDQVKPAGAFRGGSKIPIDPELCFGPEKKLKKGKRLHTIYSVDDGEIYLPSGVIGIAELNADPDRFFPLEYRVKPGVYKIEKGMNQTWQHCVAVRVKFDESKPAVKYVPANFVGSNNQLFRGDQWDHAIAIFDAQSVTSVSSREVERWGRLYRFEIRQKRDSAPTELYDKSSWVLNPRKKINSPRANLVSIFERNFSVKLCFWGLSKQNEIVSLVVIDGDSYCEPMHKTLSFDWDASKTDPFHHPEFKRMGVDVSIDSHGQFTMNSSTRPFYLDADLIEIIDSRGDRYSIPLYFNCYNSLPHRRYFHFTPDRNQVYKVKLLFATDYRLSLTQPSGSEEN